MTYEEAVLATFEKLTDEEMLGRHGVIGNGVRASSEPLNYVRHDGFVTVCVVRHAGGHKCMLVDEGGVTMGRESDDPVDALIHGLTRHLAPVAVAEAWTKPMKWGLKFCCEDVVNVLAYWVAQATLFGLDGLAYETVSADSEPVDRCMGAAIAHCRANARELGIVFEDVWSD